MTAETCHAATVPIERAVTGTTVGVDETTICGRCGRSVGERSLVGVYAYSLADERDITVARTTCADCSSDAIEYPTLGATEWLVRGTLALRSDVACQSHTLVFVSDDGGVVAMSPPTDGSGER